MTKVEIPSHVAHRIVEETLRQHPAAGDKLTTDMVESIIHGDLAAAIMIGLDVSRTIDKIAREYGIESNAWTDLS